MKRRLALLLLALALALLPACGSAASEPTTVAINQAPTAAITQSPTTTELKPVPEATLTIVEQGWDDWAAMLPELELPLILPITLEDNAPVHKGDTFEGEADSLLWKMTIVDITDEGVEVRFETKGIVKPYTDGPYDWTETIPFGEEYRIITDTFDAGTTWYFIFDQK